jgi:hypothetical protein
VLHEMTVRADGRDCADLTGHRSDCHTAHPPARSA